jgi:hypothetical protein
MGRGWYILLWRRELRLCVKDGFVVRKKIIRAVRSVEFISDRKLNIILRDSRFNIIVLNARASCEDNTDDVNDRFCEKIGRLLN